MPDSFQDIAEREDYWRRFGEFAIRREMERRLEAYWQRRGAARGEHLKQLLKDVADVSGAGATGA